MSPNSKEPSLHSLKSPFCCVLLFVAVGGFAGTWTPLIRLAPDSVELMLLLPDGTVMAANQTSNPGSEWYRLTPDIHGSYVNGTWTTLAAMHETRLYYSSAVLRDGRVFVAGGEYGTGKGKGEIYDPRTDSWTELPPSGQSFSDSISKVIANGNILIDPVGPSSSGGTVMFNPTANSWEAGPKLFRGFYEDEASWVKLPDDSIITIDPFGTNSERYIPSLNRWINDANVPVSLYNAISEIGPGFLLPNGKAFFIGGTTHTALYTPSGTTNAGTWAAGPEIPNGLGSSDSAAAMMVNGKVLCTVGSTTSYDPPTSFFEYDPVANSFAQVNGPTGTTDNVEPYATAMLDLPDGTVLYSHFGSRLYVYQPGGTPVAAGKPAISTLTQNPDGSYHLTGTLFNGISEGAAYGDDAQMDSNYPLVRMTNSGGNVYYARTFNWSSTGVMTGNKVVSTEFALPSNLPVGTNSLVVVANGISSAPVPFTPGGLRISPSTGFTAVGPAGGPFDNTQEDFSLNNAGASSLAWTVINASTLLAVSPTSGTLPASGAATVNVSLAAKAYNVLPGTYSASVVFSNVTDHTFQARSFTLQIPYENFQSYSNTVLSMNPLGYWRLNETNQPLTDGTALNLGYLGSSADGSYSGVPAWVSGALKGDTDTATSFSGASAVDVPYIPSFTLSPPFTIEAWVRAAVSQTSGNFACALACGEFADPRSGWLIYQSATGWNFRMYNQNGLTTSLNVEAGGAPVPGVWYHVAATYDGSLGAIYVNGTGSTPTLADFVPNTDGDLTIGSRSDDSFYFGGSVDEVAIYNQVLSPSDILDHYQAGTNASPATPYDQLVLGQNPMVYFRLDSPGGQPIAVNEGTLAAGANGFYEAGVVAGLPGATQNGFDVTNHACLFNGLVGFVDIPGGSLNLTGPVTVVAWTKANPANGYFQTIVGKGDTSFRLDMDQNGRPGFSDGQQAIGDLFATNRIDDGQWHQLIGTYDGAHAERLYVDGRLAATTNSANTPVAGNVSDLWLGGAPDYGITRIFSGLIDEVAVFNTVLSSNQVRQLYFSAFAIPPVFNSVNRVGNAINLNWSAVTGQTYQVQYRTNLVQSNWINAGSTVLATNTTATLSDLPGSDRQRFYRVFIVP